jgi:serine/threonine protein kinase
MKQTQTQSGFGTTPVYAALEVLSMKQPTSKVDIWALGLILY